MRNKIFNLVRPAKVKKSAFDLTHEVKLTGKMGHLIPVLCQEVVPGDHFTIDTQSFIRFPPLVSPVMHRINAYVHYFYVPNRILWENWEKFITNQDDSLTLPKLNLETVASGSIGDYLGLPTGTHSNGDEEINDLPFRAYAKIYNDYYRDENCATELDLDQAKTLLNADPLLRSWEKDYFTSAMKQAQKGDPVAVSANIDYLASSELYKFDGTAATPGNGLVGATDGTETHLQINSADARVENLEEVTIDINELRTAQRLQRWLERNARAGTRYVEHLLGHWGVVSSDQRLQRAEYIGGGKSPVVISEVLNTAGDLAGTEFLPVGSMAGHGLGLGMSNIATKFVEEHGFIMGILSVIPESSYCQGIHKLWSRQINLDFYYPEFANLGEQPVYNRELVFTDTEVDDNNVFGYQSRYAEYKSALSSIHGDFRGNLWFWHLGRHFTDCPTLSKTFMEIDPADLDRVYAVQGEAQILCQLLHRIKAVRPMPFYNEPNM